MKNIIAFFNKKYFLFLLLLVIISYGQLLLMHPWQEDNVIFFKLTHINERAGYLGIGVFGSGVYKYIITPYYALYSLFGYNIPLFYLLDLIMYFVATLCVFLAGKTIVSRKAGMLASFLFACGYIAYDGFVRVYNSISSSLGIIFLSLLLSSYWKFYKTGKPIFYILSVIFYGCAVEFSYIRSHYLILPVIAFEFIFFAIPLKLSSILKSILRIIPFLFIFYQEYLVSSDSRTNSTTEVAKSILNGQLDHTFSFISTIGNLVIPDKFQEFLLLIISKLIPYKSLQLLTAQVFISIVFLGIIYYIFKNKPKWISLLFSGITILWIIISQKIYTVPTLIYSSDKTVLAAFIGGLALLLSFSLIISLKNDARKLLLVLSILITANIAAYAAYTPFTPYGSGYRYLAQSYVGLIIIIILLLNSLLQKKHYSKLPLYLFIGWGLIILGIGVTNMHTIVETKSNRIVSFYNQLRSHVSNIPKDSVILFDIQDNPEARSWYGVSFSVAEMPDTTAIAWRYGIDRYDFKMFTEYSDLIKEIQENKVPLDKVFTFFVTKDTLINTTPQFRTLAQSGSNLQTIFNDTQIESRASVTKTTNVDTITQEELIINLQNPIENLTGLKVDLELKATPIALSQLVFPIKYGDKQNSIHNDTTKHQLAFNYLKEKLRFLNEASYTANSQWKERVIQNLHDGDKTTVWQADRVEWSKNKAIFTIDLKQPMDLAGIAWINGFANNTPISYVIETSVDDKNWQTVASVQESKRLENTQIQSTFFNPTRARFLRMVIDKTLSEDSPGIAEAWPISAPFQSMDINELDTFSKNPFAYIDSYVIYSQLLQNLNLVGNIQYSWLSDKSEYWITTSSSVIPVLYDGVTNRYTLNIPPAGTKITKLKLSDFTIPGTVIIESLDYQNEKISPVNIVDLQ